MSAFPPPDGPSQLNYLTPTSSGPDLRDIAGKQRAIILCILANLIAIVSQFMLPPAVRVIVALLILGIGITATVFVFMLAMTIYSTAAGIALGILAIIPYIGLLPMLIVNGKATRILRQHGIKVGLLGAKMNQLGPR
ncbi:MAG TPA: hypothetical protein VGG44_06020 [Tepidisphaeraceae bacterium]|jgi:hypothetical protein